MPTGRAWFWRCSWSMAGFLAWALLLATVVMAADAPPVAPMPGRQATTPATSPTPVAAPAKIPATTPSTPGKAPSVTQSAEAIETLTLYYLDMFQKHLQSKDWMARAMGVISLAQIDDPRTTAKLVGIMTDDRELIVRIYVWEAVHGRQAKLDDMQRQIWKVAGYRMADKGELRGDLRLAIVGLIEEDGPTGESKARLKRIFAETSSLNPSDARTLFAVGDTVKRWQSADMARWLIEQMKVLDNAYRAEMVLQRLCKTIPSHGMLRMESSDVMWGTTYQRWVKWLDEQKYKEIAPKDAQRYTGRSTIMPPGEKITDTADPKWRKDLELTRFRLDQLDVGFAVDSTASMGATLEWIKHDVFRMMRTFELISREPRIGVTLYRDQGDAYVTRNIPFSGSAKAIQEQLKNEQPKGGGDVPEDVLSALVALIGHQQWSPAPGAKKVIVVLSDAPPKQDSLERIKEVATKAVDQGFLIHAIKIRTSKYIERVMKLPNYDPELTTFDHLAKWGQGSSTWVEFWGRTSSNPRWLGVAHAIDGNSAERVIFREVLRSVLEKGYRDRVDPFIGVLLEYVEEPMKETREPFPKATPGRPGTPSDPQMSR